MSLILRILVLAALVLAPATMHDAKAAPGQHHNASADAHCAGGTQTPTEGDEGRGADCALACSAMPAASAELDAALVARSDYAAARLSFFAGTAPGSDPPPPRQA